MQHQEYKDLHTLFETINTKNQREHFEYIKILLREGADINDPNDEDHRTPLGVFVNKSKNWKTKLEDWRVEILEYCLNNAKVDVDMFREGELREKIKEYFPDTIIKSYRMEINLNVLKSLLNPYKEARFAVYYKTYKEKNGTNETWQQDLNELVKAAVYSGKLASVEKLVEDGFDIDSYSELPELLSRCCNYGNYDILKVLLKKLGHNYKEGNEENITSTMSERSVEQINKYPLLSMTIKGNKFPSYKDNGSFFKCFKCLLSIKDIQIDKTDERGFSALHLAVKYKDDEVVKLLLEHKAYIGKQNMFKEIPICEISPEVLEDYLDSCITTNDKGPEEDEYEIKIDFSCLVLPELKKKKTGHETSTANRSSDEMVPIKYIAKSSNLKHLLKHPVIASFVLLKWLMLCPYFYINFFICAVLFLSLTSYVVVWYGLDAVDSYLKVFVIVLAWPATVCVLLREVIQMMLHKTMYFKSLANWMEMALILVSFTVLLKSDFGNETRQAISAVLILLSTVEFILLLGTLPISSLSTHMEMLKTVSTNFLKCLVLYSTIIISFAFCFYTLFSVRTSEDDPASASPATGDSKHGKETEDGNQFNNFADIGTSLLKTLVMLTGEFDAASIIFDTNGFSYLVFVLFIFFVPIVIFNLMNGLAVSDTAAIKAQAELIGLSQKVDVFSKYENALETSIIQRYLSKFRLCSFLKPLLEDLPSHCVFVELNKSNDILKEGSSNNGDAENVESRPLNQQRCLLNNIHVLCCRVPYLSRMDGNILKYAKEILSSRNREIQSMEKYQLEKNQLEQRLEKIDRDIGEILTHLKQL